LDNKLTLHETRVLACLIEKETTTPDQYPLSLNSLTNACNQKSNRDPVLQLDEATVRDVVDELIKRHLVSEQAGFGSRVVKIRHRFCNTEFNDLQFSDQELAIISLLFLRGAQTPGELRTRSSRLCNFNDVEEVEATLNELTIKNGGPYVVRLSRIPGKRESRFTHLFSGDIDNSKLATQPEMQSDHNNYNNRLSDLEIQVLKLREEFESIKQILSTISNN
jgi:uncharacterized protein YceH (UPF0502 family)